MKLRRGLRKEFDELAVEMRQEVSVGHWDQLDPAQLCEALEIPLLALSSVSLSAEDRERLLSSKGGSFFGCVLPLSDSKSAIVYNDTNSVARVASDICHEIAHILIGHDLQAPMIEGGERSYNARDEHEARELGMSILLPKESCKLAADKGISDAQIAQHFGVSTQLSSYRMRISNARNWSYNARTRARSYRSG